MQNSSDTHVLGSGFFAAIFKKKPPKNQNKATPQPQNQETQINVKKGLGSVWGQLGKRGGEAQMKP